MTRTALESAVNSDIITNSNNKSNNCNDKITASTDSLELDIIDFEKINVLESIEVVLNKGRTVYDKTKQHYFSFDIVLNNQNFPRCILGNVDLNILISHKKVSWPFFMPLTNIVTKEDIEKKQVRPHLYSEYDFEKYSLLMDDLLSGSKNPTAYVKNHFFRGIGTIAHYKILEYVKEGFEDKYKLSEYKVRHDSPKKCRLKQLNKMGIKAGNPVYILLNRVIKGIKDEPFDVYFQKSKYHYKKKFNLINTH